MHRRIGAGEFGDALAAAAAGRRRATVDLVGDDADLLDRAAPRIRRGGDHRTDRRGLGAPAFRIGGILDIGTDMGGAGTGAKGGADQESRIGCVGLQTNRACGIEQFRLHDDPLVCLALLAASSRLGERHATGRFDGPPANTCRALIFRPSRP
jgi:hypothetical protein